jgi:hypothetical protein
LYAASLAFFQSQRTVKERLKNHFISQVFGTVLEPKTVAKDTTNSVKKQEYISPGIEKAGRQETCAAVEIFSQITADYKSIDLAAGLARS